MLYTLAGVPLIEALPIARLQYAEWMQRHAQRPTNYLINRESGQRAHKVGRDKNGDVYPVFRAFHEHRTGAGFAARLEEKKRQLRDALKGSPVWFGALDGGKSENMLSMEPSLWHAIKAALAQHGSQRKAAAALGISLGKLQRTLKMVPGGQVS